MSGDQPISELKINLWMPLDIGPFLQDTAHLSTEEIGAYTLLLLYYWAHGPLPNDPKRLANIAKMSADTWSITHEALSIYFFKGSDGLLHQKGADRRRAQWLDKRLKAREKALKAINARWSKHRAKVAAQSNTPSIPEEVRREVLENYPTSVKTSTRDYDPLRVSPSLPAGAAAPKGGSSNPTSPEPATGKPPASAKQNETKAKPLKRGLGRIAKGGNDGTGTAGASKSGARGLGLGVGHLKNQSSRPKADFPADSRWEPFRVEIFKYWDQQNLGDQKAGNCPWTVKDQAALSGLLRAAPEMTLETFRGLLMNRARSEVVASDPPRNWLAGLKLFAAGPLDRYRHSLRPARIH
jgi:uncharacterized protein YdaU (DUF1376 family)